MVLAPEAGFEYFYTSNKKMWYNLNDRLYQLNNFSILSITS